jgi:hypothetical protein
VDCCAISGGDCCWWDVADGSWDSAVEGPELDSVEESARAEGEFVYSKGGEKEEGFGFEISRYRMGDALIRSCAADSEAKRARNVFGVGLRGSYC